MFEEHIYYRPYFRHAPYLVGLGCADIYMRTKDKVKNKKDTWWKVFILQTINSMSYLVSAKLFIFTYYLQIFVLVMWAVAIAMNLALLYGIYPYNKETTFIEPVWLNDLHAATHRTVWALIVAWITYACLTGWGGILPLISKTNKSVNLSYRTFSNRGK